MLQSFHGEEKNSSEKQLRMALMQTTIVVGENTFHCFHSRGGRKQCQERRGKVQREINYSLLLFATKRFASFPTPRESIGGTIKDSSSKIFPCLFQVFLLASFCSFVRIVFALLWHGRKEIAVLVSLMSCSQLMLLFSDRFSEKQKEFLASCVCRENLKGKFYMLLFILWRVG